MGSKVDKGQLIAGVRSVTVESELRGAENQIALSTRALENQKIILRRGSDNADQIELLKESLENAKRMKKEYAEQLAATKVVAKVDGLLLPMSALAPNRDRKESLDRSTSPMLPVNQDCFVGRGEPIGLIVNKDTLRAELLVSESRIDLVKPGQSTRLSLGQHSTDFVYGEVESIGYERVLNRNSDTNNSERADLAEENFVKVTVRFKDELDANVDAKLTAVVFGETLPAYQQVWRMFRENFRW